MATATLRSWAEATAVDELGKGLCVVAIAYQARSGRWFMLGLCWSLGES